MSNYTVTLKCLEDAPNTVEAAPFESLTEGLRLFRSHAAITAAGDNGAINVWRDHAGRYRVSHYRYLALIDGRVLSTLKQVREWLKTHLPQIQ